jgi:glycosyltransferase involved in cell wall biosynthesis
MNISVVIPTCNRKSNLLNLLKNLNESTYPLHEIIIIDSGDDNFTTGEFSHFQNLHIEYQRSERSVCIQRNIGIRKAKSPLVFLCDDDIEVPLDYLQKLTAHISDNPEAGAVSGLVLQKENNKWVSQYNETSIKNLIWKYIFKLGIWGSIESSANNLVSQKLKNYYKQKGNHLSKAGWPVLINFSGKYFITPVYGLGASLIKKEWLLNSLYDEVLDSHGIGDHYGVAAGLPGKIHIVTDAFVYHHQEKTNRLKTSLQYYRRVLALDHFIRQGRLPEEIKRRWLAWSLFGNFIQSVFSMNFIMLKPAFKSLYIVCFGKNPYDKATKKNKKVIEPDL